LIRLGVTAALRYGVASGVTAAGGGGFVGGLFGEAKKTAKVTGALLACALAIGFPFYS
jgi:hypothetical protein